jgi:NAD(P)-dependent dehydrogenase (short-subunit alcohol dehydrogenase family)
VYWLQQGWWQQQTLAQIGVDRYRLCRIASLLSEDNKWVNAQRIEVSIYYRNNTLAYNTSKVALNAITISLAKDLASEQIRINSICPGWVKTDLGTDAAYRTVEQGAAIIVKLATMENPPTGKFLDDNGDISW